MDVLNDRRGAMPLVPPVTFAKKLMPGAGNVSTDRAALPDRATRFDAAIAAASSFAIRAYRARKSWMTFGRLTPGVRMLLLKKVLAGVVVSVTSAESSRS